MYSDCLGAMYQCGSVTEAVFLWMLTDVLLIVESGDTQVQPRDSQRIVSPTKNPLQPGDYVIYSSGTYVFGVPFEDSYLMI